jgi:hypothetical protein
MSTDKPAWLLFRSYVLQGLDNNWRPKLVPLLREIPMFFQPAAIFHSSLFQRLRACTDQIAKNSVKDF